MHPGTTGSAVPEAPQRPEDVVTGFWLWVIALPLLLIGYVTDTVVAPVRFSTVIVVLVTVAVVLVLATVVLTFLFLMRAGYRWARSILTGGAIMSIGFTVSSLFTTDRPTAAALIYAVTGIVGVVLLAGGMVLLHRKDAQAYFTR
ncbi:MAG: hypothetical protein HYZ38_20245 [Mycobacterium sp.]|nr:hypothetical protein [Mycobacterium sp.]